MLGSKTDVLPACRNHDLGVIVWAPLNGGWLTGKYQGRGTDDPDTRAAREPEHFDHADETIRVRKQAAIDRLIDLAEEAGMSLAQLALDFVLDDPTLSAAIIGPRTEAQLAELLSLGELVLPDHVRSEIDAVIAPGENLNPADAG